MSTALQIVIFGLSITSSWGNGHATTYRSLVKALVARGHKVLFLERDVPWYAQNRDLARMPGCDIVFYKTLKDLKKHTKSVGAADFIMVGSYVPEGIAVGEWALSNAACPTAFYDIDTPVTLARLDDTPYLCRKLIPRYQIYLSFTGGPILQRLETELGAQRARPLYCSVDPDLYFPQKSTKFWDLGYLGTYSSDRQPTLERLMIEPARLESGARFIVTGPQYPESITWPPNVHRVHHLAPSCHRAFYNQQRFTLNITRRDMREAGYSPSVRLFEAAACGTPIISDDWEGLDSFFEPGKEILVASTAEDVLRALTQTTTAESRSMGQAARKRVLANHTAAHRAAELEGYILEVLGRKQKV